jgi:hypothetical protein
VAAAAWAAWTSDPGASRRQKIERAASAALFLFSGIRLAEPAKQGLHSSFWLDRLNLKADRSTLTAKGRKIGVFP